MRHSYEKFVDEVMKWQNGQIEMNDSLFRQIRIFQFSQYLFSKDRYYFLKYLPNFHSSNNYSNLLENLKEGSLK